MEKIIIPTPGEVKYGDGEIKLNGKISYNCGEFDGCGSAFTQYLIKCHHISPSGGDGGINIIKEKRLKPEGYEICCADNEITIAAADRAGVHHAFSTLLQLSVLRGSEIYVPKVNVKDFPFYPYRGLMVDVARCPHDIKFLFDYVDICYFYKLSYLQLHFTDDTAFTLPAASLTGLKESYGYTREQIRKLTEYARFCGVTLVPELDIPGHSAPFMRNYPEIFGSGKVLPADERVFGLLSEIFSDMAGLFPDSPYIHIGGDEAKIDGWETCEKTIRYCAEKRIGGLQHLYAHYVSRCAQMILDMGRIPIVWEGFHREYNHLIPKETVVISWENYYQPVNYLARDGFKIINCSWKPLYIVTPSPCWPVEEILDWDPYKWKHHWEASAAYKGIALEPDNEVMGGQLCAWGDNLLHYEDSLKGCLEEMELICGRAPALSERTWRRNGADYNAYWEAGYKECCSMLKKILRAFE